MGQPAPANLLIPASLHHRLQTCYGVTRLMAPAVAYWQRLKCYVVKRFALSLPQQPHHQVQRIAIQNREI